jgi:hypothetical protein
VAIGNCPLVASRSVAETNALSDEISRLTVSTLATYPAVWDIGIGERSGFVMYRGRLQLALRP